MPSVTYMNRSAPFWDFVASLEQEGMNHPFFAQWAQSQGNNPTPEADAHHGPAGHPHPPPPPPFGAWGWPFAGFGGRGFPHRGPPPPPGPPPPFEEQGGEKDRDKEKEKEEEKDGDENDNGEGPSGSGSETEGCPRGRGRHGRCGSRRGRHCGGRGGFGPHHGSPYHGGPHHGGPHHGPHGRRGGWGPWGGRGGPFGGPWNPLGFAAHLFDSAQANPNAASEDFTPEADVFDTPSSFVIHIALPGAKKEDVGVNWDAEKSELSVAGVVYRPGDEAFLKTLALDERRVGPFERKVRLGTRANPAQVDVDGITAKLEDGVLMVEVPKMGENGFVEVRKVDIE